MNVKKIGAGAAMVGALAATGIGAASAVASADQSLPQSPAITWKLDRGHGHGHDRDWDNWNEWDGWRGGPGWDNRGGACVWVPPAVSIWVPPAFC